MTMHFSEALDYVHRIDFDGDVLEIGSERGAGSTYIFSTLAHNVGKTLYSVDVDHDVIERNISRFETFPFQLPVSFHHQTGEQFLAENKDLRFSVVLLDNFDWQWNPNSTEDFIQAQVDRYKTEFNLEMNNLNSQKTHLAQAIAMTPMLTDKAIIVCDDTYWVYEFGVYTGKCGAAIPYLLTQGFHVAHQKDQCVILIRE